MPKDYRAIKILFGTFKGGGQKTDINKRERERERERQTERETDLFGNALSFI